MASEINIGADISFPASGDLSANQHRFVKLNSSKQVALCGAGQSALGIQQDAPAATNRATEVRYLGVSKLLLGGTVAADGLIASDASGKGVAYTAASVLAGTPEPLAGSYVAAKALEAGVSGDIVTVLLIHAGICN